MRKIAILGFGKEGEANLRYFQAKEPEAELTILDANPETQVPGVKTQVGPGYLSSLAQFDLIVRSPGINPQLPELQVVQAKLTSATAIFFKEAAAAGARLIGITGTKGKSTTTSLIAAGLEAAGASVSLVGNIGRPMLDYLDQAKPGHIFVCELSSYQLEGLHQSPDVAVLTSLFPEHLDYHQSWEGYFNAKANICRYQTAANLVIYNAGNDDCVKMAALSPGQKIAITAKDAPVQLEELKLIGQHNLLNVALAARAVQAMGYQGEAVNQAFRDFPGLPHRLMTVGQYQGVTWIDDAISTTPESTVAGLKALAPKAITLLAGGLDRGYNFEPLAEAARQGLVKHFLLMPDTGAGMAATLQEAGLSNYEMVPDLETAVQKAAQLSQAGEIVLLSPASPSYNRFKNFEEKGDLFAKLAKQLSSTEMTV